MKAARFEQYGDPDVLTLEEVPTPEPKPGRVRVRVLAVGVNPADWKIRRGLFNPGQSAPDRRRGTGLELAGVIDALGDDVSDVMGDVLSDAGGTGDQGADERRGPGGGPVLHVGDSVFGTVGTGAAAEYAIAKPENLVRKPGWLSYERAAALPVASEAACRTVLRLLDVSAGQVLLVHAAAGAVGLVATQLALARGAQVIGTASEERHDFLEELGVWPVPYGEGWERRVAELTTNGVDRVLDASGRGVLPGSVRLAGVPGHVVTIADMTAAEENGVRFSSGGPVPMAEVFDTVLPLIREGRMLLPVHRTFRLDNIADAHRESERAHHLGKIVLSLP